MVGGTLSCALGLVLGSSFFTAASLRSLLCASDFWVDQCPNLIPLTARIMANSATIKNLEGTGKSLRGADLANHATATTHAPLMDTAFTSDIVSLVTSGTKTSARMIEKSGLDTIPRKILRMASTTRTVLGNLVVM